jgi:hypothetical protein
VAAVAAAAEAAAGRNLFRQKIKEKSYLRILKQTSNRSIFKPQNTSSIFLRLSSDNDC